VPLQRVVDHSILLCYGQDTVILPILAEVLVVEKRLMLQKVLHIRTRRVETHQPQRWVIRHEVPVQDEHGEYA
jgi:hypothetical protein